METITITTTYRRGRRLFAYNGTESYAALKDDGSNARGLVWIEQPGQAPQVGEASSFRHLFPSQDQRSVRGAIPVHTTSDRDIAGVRPSGLDGTSPVVEPGNLAEAAA